MEVEVTTAISMSVERYNELIQAEPYKRLAENGFADLELISFNDSVRLSVPVKLKLGQVARAAALLMPIPMFGGGELYVRSTEGILLELNREIEEYKFKYGEHLFIETH